MTPYLKAFHSVPGQTIPHRHVSIKIAVNEDHCIAPAWLKKKHETNIRLSLPEIVWAGTVHWTDTILVYQSKKQTDLEARMTYVTQDLCRVSPRAERSGHRMKLVVTDIKNTDENSRATFILGNAIGVAVAKKLLKVSYAAFTRRDFAPDVFHDYDIHRKNRTIKLEVRGRFRGLNKGNAIEGVKEKFKDTRDFNQALGILVYPSDKAARTHPDVEIIDPQGDAAPPHPGYTARQILCYYNAFFTEQKVAIFKDIDRALEMSDDDLWDSLQSDSRLFYGTKGKHIPSSYFGRKAALIGGTRYFGTEYKHWAPPVWRSEEYRSMHKDGVLFWGISEHVIDSLNNTSILGLLDSMGETRTNITKAGTELILFDDGILIGWAPNRPSFPRSLAE